MSLCKGFWIILLHYYVVSRLFWSVLSPSRIKLCVWSTHTSSTRQSFMSFHAEVLLCSLTLTLQVNKLCCMKAATSDEEGTSPGVFHKLTSLKQERHSMKPRRHKTWRGEQNEREGGVFLAVWPWRRLISELQRTLAEDKRFICKIMSFLLGKTTRQTLNRPNWLQNRLSHNHIWLT